MRSPEAWTRKRMGEAHATHRSRTTGATGARKSETTMTGRHAALHAKECSDGEPGEDGQDSAVGTSVPPTASEKLRRRVTPTPAPPSPSTPFAFADRLMWRRQTRPRLVGLLGQVRVRREGQGGRPSPASLVRRSNGDGLQDSPDDIAQVAKALRLSGSTRASLPLTPRGALSIGRLGCDTLV
eukprot:3836879-Pleurochrysis_carterae.AAC.1